MQGKFEYFRAFGFDKGNTCGFALGKNFIGIFGKSIDRLFGKRICIKKTAAAAFNLVLLLTQGAFSRLGNFFPLPKNLSLDRIPKKGQDDS
jgi:hypothetical protein